MNIYYVWLNKDMLPTNWKVKKNNSIEFLKITKQLMKSKLSDDEIHSELLSLVKYPKYYEFDHYTYVDKKGPFRASDLTAPGSKTNIVLCILQPISLAKWVQEVGLTQKQR